MEIIKAGNYTGYLWYSDSNKPVIFVNGKAINNDTQINFSEDYVIQDGTNPFIIEGQLFDNNISYSIKFLDGRYMIKKFDLSKMKGEYDELVFLGNRISVSNKSSWLKFRQYWKEKTDDIFCMGMYVMQPAERVFVGFKEEEEVK